MAKAQRGAPLITDPDDFDLEQLAGHMTARALGCESEEAGALAKHEVGQFLHRWLKRQDRPAQKGLRAAYGLGEDA